MIGSLLPSMLPTIRRTRQTYAEWAEEHIIVPDGPHRGTRFRANRQPFMRLFFAELDRNKWRRVFVTGPAQSGKSFLVRIVIARNLMGFKRKVILGIPDMRMAAQHWDEELLPVLLSAGFGDLLPTRGTGSRQGTKNLDAIHFSNGTSLRFMSGGGGDATRSNYEAPVVIIHEVDKLDVVGGTSRESDKVGQLEARLGSHDDRSLFLGESTPSTSTGRVWREIQSGTASRIACPCPHCGEWVTPEREHLIGWQKAANVVEAAENATFACPACGATINDAERVRMNREAVLLHRGQTPNGGELDPPTDTFGFRWSAFNNLFWKTRSIAAREWRAANEPDAENSETRMLQFVWAMPHDPPRVDLTAIDWLTVARRVQAPAKGVVPRNTQFLTLGADLGLRLVHWVLLATDTDGAPHVCDYGVLEVKSDDLSEDRALLVALRELRDMAERAWSDEDGKRWGLDRAFVDSGWHGPDVVYPFVAESAGGTIWWMATKGHGASQGGRRYMRPKSTGAVVQYIGEGYHIARLQASGVALVEIDGDAWKSYVHARLKCPVSELGSLTLFAADFREHTSYAKHLVAERRYETEVPGVGPVVQWENKSGRANHYLDATYQAAAAAHLCGARLIRIKQQAVPAPVASVPSEPEEGFVRGGSFVSLDRFQLRGQS